MTTFQAHFDDEAIVSDESVGVRFEEYIQIPIEERLDGLRNSTGPRLAAPDPNSGWPREEIYTVMGPSELPFDEWKRRFDALPRLECGPNLPADALRRENLYEERR